MGSAERRERERQEVRTVILDGARAIMSERGFDGLTMRAVADRIEYSPAAIYKHFADREDLVRELCAHDFYAFNEMLRSRPGSTKPDADDHFASLRAIGRAYAEFGLRYPEQYRVMFMTPLPVEAKLVDEDPGADAYQTLVDAVQEVCALGHFGSLDPHLIAQTMWATMHGVVGIEIVHLCLDKRRIPFASMPERVETAVDSVLLGLEAVAQKRARAPQAKPRRAKRRTTPRR